MARPLTPPPDATGYAIGEDALMSQEERDRRLGLTGLSPAQRARRIEELQRRLAEEHAVAKAKLEAHRAARSAEQQAEAEQHSEDVPDQL